MSTPRVPNVSLNNGIKMPIVGLGVYQTPPGKETRHAVAWALEAGYRHIDTASAYRNEEDVGAAIRESGIPRDQLFVTTKLWNSDQGYDSALAACEKSLQKLGLDYLDLYLIHWPVQEKRLDSWRAMEKLLDGGKCRAVGVSNFMERHLEELLKKSSLVPAVNQVELSPFLNQKKLLEYCMRRGIQMEAYGPLTQGKKLDHPSVAAIAQRHERTGAQVLLRWAIQKEIVVIPKSVHQARIVENFKVFDFSLNAEEMETLSNLNENFRTCWNPSDVP